MGNAVGEKEKAYHGDVRQSISLIWDFQQLSKLKLVDAANLAQGR